MRKKVIATMLSAAMCLTTLTTVPVAQAADSNITNTAGSNTATGETVIKGVFGTNPNGEAGGGVSLISVAVPATINFTVTGNTTTDITASSNLMVANNSATPVDVKISKFVQKTPANPSKTYTVVADPIGSGIAWESLSHADRKISLGISKQVNSGFNDSNNMFDSSAGTIVWAQPAGSNVDNSQFIGVLPAKNTSGAGRVSAGGLDMHTYHGKAFTSEEIGLSLGEYQIEWTISIH